MVRKQAAAAMGRRPRRQRPVRPKDRKVCRRGVAAVELFMLTPVLAMLLVRVIALEENSVPLIGALLCVSVYLISRLCVESPSQ